MLKNTDEKDEAMPDLEEFSIPDIPRPLARIEFMEQGFQVTQANGTKETINISEKELKSLQKQPKENSRSKNKRKTVELDPYEKMSITEARNSRTTILRRKDGKMVQPASPHVSDAIQARTTIPGITNEQRDKISQIAKKDVLDRVGIQDKAQGVLRFPDPQNKQDQIKLSQQRRITTWVPSPSISIEGCFKFRDHAHRGLTKETTRIPIAGSHFDQQMTEWAGDLRSIVTALPLLNIPISTPIILAWLVDKHWPVVSDSLDIISCYICALRLLIGGMDVGEKVLNRKTDKLFIYEDRETEVVQGATHNPLWSFENMAAITKQRLEMKKLRYPIWFDLGKGQTPSVKRNRKLSDDDLEKIMIQAAIRNKSDLKDVTLVKLNAGLTILEKDVIKIKTKNNRKNLDLPTMRHFMDRLYSLSEIATYQLIASYELTLLWVVQRYVAFPLLNNLSKIQRKVLNPPLPTAFVEYILKRRITLFQTRSYLGGIIPSTRPKPGQDTYTQSMIRTDRPSFPTIQEMNAFYQFLQIKTKGQQDLIQRLSQLDLATHDNKSIPEKEQ